MDVRVGPLRKLSTEELILLNCGVGEDSRVTWTVRKCNQSILKEICPECSLEGLMLKLKLQYSDHLMRTADSFEGDDRERDGWMTSLMAKIEEELKSLLMKVKEESEKS